MKKIQKTEENWRVFSSCILLMMVSIFPAIVFASLWLVLDYCKISILEHSSSVIHKSHNSLGIIYVFFIKYAVEQVHKQYCKIISFAEAHHRTFEKYRDYKNGNIKFKEDDAEKKFKEKISELKTEYIGIRGHRLAFWFHVFMAIISFFFVLTNFTDSYENWIAGSSWIFALTYIMFFVFMLAKVMENPIEGVYRIKTIPLEWLKDEEV